MCSDLDTGRSSQDEDIDEVLLLLLVSCQACVSRAEIPWQGVPRNRAFFFGRIFRRPSLRVVPFEGMRHHHLLLHRHRGAS